MENFAYKLKLARRASGLTQGQVAEHLGMTKQAYGKYERGLSKPNSTRLIEFCELFDREPDFFMAPARIDLEALNFRKRAKLSGKALHKLKARVVEAVEHVLFLEDRLHIQAAPPLPKLRQVAPLTKADEHVDALADKLRSQWKLGFDAIPNLRGLIEFQGIRVVELDEETVFDGLCTVVDGRIPIIVMNTAKGVDKVRRRFTLAHELAHLLLDIDEENIGKREIERICDRFAGALLLPAATLRRLLGDYRTNLSLHELTQIRAQFGVSVAAIVYRAATLGIYPQSIARDYWILRNGDEDLKSESSFPPYPTESSSSDYLNILLARAVAEDTISISKGAAISGLSFDEVRQLGKRPEGLSARAYT